MVLSPLVSPRPINSFWLRLRAKLVLLLRLGIRILAPDADRVDERWILSIELAVSIALMTPIIQTCYRIQVVFHLFRSIKFRILENYLNLKLGQN